MTVTSSFAAMRPPPPPQQNTTTTGCFSAADVVADFSAPASTALPGVKLTLAAIAAFFPVGLFTSSAPSSLSNTPSSTGPLGPRYVVERASGSWWFAPGHHWRSMSCSIYLSIHRWSFDERAWLLNSHVSAEQSVNRTNFLPHKNGLKCWMAHNTGITSRSLADHLTSVLDHRWLAYPIARSSPLVSRASVSPAPSLLASVCS